MKCTICGKEDQWLEIIGKSMACRKCVTANKEMFLVHRTHIDTFHFILRKLKPADYDAYMKISRKDIEAIANLKGADIRFKTTNVVRLN